MKSGNESYLSHFHIDFYGAVPQIPQTDLSIKEIMIKILFNVPVHSRPQKQHITFYRVSETDITDIQRHQQCMQNTFNLTQMISIDGKNVTAASVATVFKCSYSDYQ